MGYHGTTRGGVSVLLHDLPPCPDNTTDFTASCSMFPGDVAATEMPSDPSAQTLNITFIDQQVRGAASSSLLPLYLHMPAAVGGPLLPVLRLCTCLQSPGYRCSPRSAHPLPCISCLHHRSAPSCTVACLVPVCRCPWRPPPTCGERSLLPPPPPPGPACIVWLPMPPLRAAALHRNTTILQLPSGMHGSHGLCCPPLPCNPQQVCHPAGGQEVPHHSLRGHLLPQAAPHGERDGCWGARSCCWCRQTEGPLSFPALRPQLLFRCPKTNTSRPATPAQLAGEPYDCTDTGGPMCSESGWRSMIAWPHAPTHPCSATAAAAGQQRLLGPWTVLRCILSASCMS